MLTSSLELLPNGEGFISEDETSQPCPYDDQLAEATRREFYPKIRLMDPIVEDEASAAS
jgi:hypothetical protein